jgi:sulfopyruvate decarboxylase alpha subunit
MSAAPRWAAGVCAGLHAAGSRHVVYVPDNPLSHVLRVLREDFTDVRTTLATREEEAFGIAAGLYLGGAKPTVMLQSSGLGNSLNALTSLLVPFKIPVLIVISMRGDAGEWNDAQVPMGRAVRPICDAIGIPHLTVDADDEAESTIRLVAQTAFGTRLPGACLLPRRITVPALRAERASAASEPRERSAPAKRRARERVGESEGQSPSDE